MCPATTGIAISTWVYGAMAVASAATAYQQQESQVDAQNAQTDAQDENNRRAVEAQQLQLEAQHEQNQQQNSLVAQRIQARQREALRERSAIRSASAEGGVGGISAQRSLLSVSLNEAEDLDSLNVQRGFNNNNLALESKGANLTARNRIDKREQQGSSAFGNVLQIGQAGLSGYSKASSVGNSVMSGLQKSSTPQLSANSKVVNSQRNLDFYRREF